MILGDILRRNARRYPGKQAVCFEGQAQTFDELNRRINRLTRALIRLGVGRGSRIAILAGNGPRYLETYGAAAKGGFCVVPLSVQFKGHEVIRAVNEVAPTVLLYEQSFAPLIDQNREALGPDLKFVPMDMDDDPRAYEALLAGEGDEEPGVSVDEHDAYSIMFTSGTTGLPKGITLSQRNILANCVNCVHAFGLREDDRNLMFLPMFFSASINCSIWPTLYIGGSLYLMRKFNAAEALKQVEEHRITYAEVVPTMIVSMLEVDGLERIDLRSLRTIVYGSAPMHVGVLRRGLEVFGDVFIQGYGLTEATCVVSVLRRDEHIADESDPRSLRLASCGREVLDVEVRVVGDEGNEVPRGEVGEITVRGDTVMGGYWNAPDATASALRDGWLYTGDLAVRDEQGYLFIVDRRKDIIISGGVNVSSREVEEVLYRHPDILEAAVIGVPDPRWGESVRAVVSAKAGAELTEGGLLAYCRERLASYKCPKSVVLVGEIPKNSNGKMQKSELRKAFGSQT